MADGELPRLVVSNSAAEVEREEAEQRRQRAEDEISWTLRHMAANLIRVVRGADKPYDLTEEAAQFHAGGAEVSR